jgi:UrcA family protein
MLYHLERLPRTILAAALAGAALTAGDAALAQSEVSGVTVTAPREIGRTTIGAPIELVSMSARVRIKDLNLKTDKGAAELNKRVSDTARNLCEELEKLYPVGTPDAASCAKSAVARARGQVDAARASGPG